MVPVEWSTGNGDGVSLASITQLAGHTDDHPDWLKAGVVVRSGVNTT